MQKKKQAQDCMDGQYQGLDRTHSGESIVFLSSTADRKSRRATAYDASTLWSRTTEVLSVQVYVLQNMEHEI